MWRQISMRTERNKSITFLVSLWRYHFAYETHDSIRNSTSLNVNDLFLNPAGQDGMVYVCYLEARLYYGEKTIVFLIFFQSVFSSAVHFLLFEVDFGVWIDDVFTAESSLWAIMSLSVHPVYSQKKKKLTTV
jgi:hypothetical protein